MPRAGSGSRGPAVMVVWALAFWPIGVHGQDGARGASSPASALGDPRHPDASRGEPSSPATEERRLALDLVFGTHLPVSVGADAIAELPGRVLVHGHVGWLPGAYVALINAVATGFDLYGDAEAHIVEDAIQDSLVGRVSLGWRPLARSGFELMLGYTVAFLGGGLSAVEALEAATGESIRGLGRRELSLKATIHAIHASIGGRWVFLERLVLRVALGYMHVVAAHADASNPGGARGAEVAQAVEGFVEELLGEKLLTPELRLMLGTRF